MSPQATLKYCGFRQNVVNGGLKGCWLATASGGEPWNDIIPRKNLLDLERLHPPQQAIGPSLGRKGIKVSAPSRGLFGH